jgi:hypothetical protein
VIALTRSAYGSAVFVISKSHRRHVRRCELLSLRSRHRRLQSQRGVVRAASCLDGRYSLQCAHVG